MSPADAFVARRRFPRRQYKCKVGLLFSSHYTIVQIRDIGEGGLLLESPSPLIAGRHVLLNFFMNQKTFISVSGEILYKKPGAITSFGIRFTNLSFEGKRAIRDYIADKSSQEALSEI